MNDKGRWLIALGTIVLATIIVAVLWYVDKGSSYSVSGKTLKLSDAVTLEISKVDVRPSTAGDKIVVLYGAAVNNSQSDVSVKPIYPYEPLDPCKSLYSGTYSSNIAYGESVNNSCSVSEGCDDTNLTKCKNTTEYKQYLSKRQLYRSDLLAYDNWKFSTTYLSMSTGDMKMCEQDLQYSTDARQKNIMSYLLSSYKPNERKEGVLAYKCPPSSSGYLLEFQGNKIQL